MAKQKKNARSNFAERVAWQRELLSIADKYLELGLHLGGILILLNMIEINVKTMILLLDVEMSVHLKKSKSSANISVVKSYIAIERLSLGRLKDLLKTRYEFKGKDEVVKKIGEANEIRKFYIHNLMGKPKEARVGGRRGKRDYKRLSEILDYLNTAR